MTKTINGVLITPENFNPELAELERYVDYVQHLIGTIDRRNNSKQAEERDRVKHTEEWYL